MTKIDLVVLQSAITCSPAVYREFIYTLYIYIYSCVYIHCFEILTTINLNFGGLQGLITIVGGLNQKVVNSVWDGVGGFPVPIHGGSSPAQSCMENNKTEM